MRTLIDIPDAMINDLREMSNNLSVSRAELVRRAVAEFLAKQSRESQTVDAFGLWGGKKTALPKDGSAYQEKLRNEWGS